PGADDVAVADLETILSVRDWFGRRGLDAFFEHAHLFDSIQVVEDHAAVAADDDQLPRFIGVRPADVDVADDVCPIAVIADGNEPDILTTVAEDLRADRAHPLGRALEQVVE